MRTLKAREKHTGGGSELGKQQSVINSFGSPFESFISRVSVEEVWWW
jgi:hypothetical protein